MRRLRAGGHLARAAALAAIVVAGILVVALFGRDRTIDAASAAQRVASAVERSLGTRPRVTCPEGVEAQRGERFTCTADSAGQRLRVRVELVDGDGAFRIVGFDAAPRGRGAAG
ncbi:MAG TPA: DUF4333 domain-containing protein [Baekduia sp.]|nr:DUF4333 domain-containing protein [Baekduia sp.]